MKDTREVFRRVFGDPKDGPFLTLRVGITITVSAFSCKFINTNLIQIEVNCPSLLGRLQCNRNFMFNHNHPEA